MVEHRSDPPVLSLRDVPWQRGLPLILLWAVGLFQLGFIVQFVLATPSVGKDFAGLYSASQVLLADGPAELLNQPHLFEVERAISGSNLHQAWVYPPVMLLLVAPLATLPYLPAFAAWMVVGCVPLIAMIRRLIGLPLAVAAVLPGVLHIVATGQNGALTASLLLGGVAAVDSKRPWLAGALFGVTIYKPQMCLLIPICLLAGRCYSALAAMIVTGIVLVGATLLLFGLDPWFGFLARLGPQMAEVLSGVVPQNRFPTVFIAVLRLTGRLELAQMIQAGSTLLAILAVWSVWRRNAGLLPRVLILAAAIPLATPYMLEYDLVLTAFPAAFVFVRAARGEATAVDWLALPVLWLMVPGIWFASYFGLAIGLPLVLGVMAYAIRESRRTAS